VGPELTAGVGFVLGGVVGVALTPLAIRVASRTGFLDRPREYRKHDAPTPFLGGTAVLAAFLTGAVAIGGAKNNWVMLVGALAMWAIGTVDDRYAVAPRWRLLAEAAAASALFSAGLGWNVAGSGLLNLVLTIAWIVAIVNAFNLMDNLDGACATVGCISAIGIGLLAARHGEHVRAGMSFALAAACAAFLRWNLAGPARIFLGDGGSMPLGFLIAGLGMATSQRLHATETALLVPGLMVGVVILDTTLVSISRTRRGVPLVTGGRDHLTHRLLGKLGTPRHVAVAIGCAQASLCALALGAGAVIALASAAIVLGLLAISVLDSREWRPDGIATRRRRMLPDSVGLRVEAPGELDALSLE
jgi:UDP-GlcNAc:undecaprenyl-phosphate GlcNAc-1-phosphate transferase